MATWLAVLGIFRLGLSLPGAPSLSLWNAGAALAYAPTGATPLLPRVAPGTVATPASCDRGGVRRLSCLSGRLWVPPSSVLPDRRLKKRATPTERTLARIFREAGARVRYNVFLRDRNVGVPAADGRRIEVLAQDLPLFGGVQLAADITLRSVLTCNGEPHLHAADVDGAMLVAARRDKEATYPELAASGRCKLVVVGIETGGWNEEGVVLMRLLARARAREAPRHLVRSTSLVPKRWTRMLSTVCAVVFWHSVKPCVTRVECLRSSLTSWRRILVRSFARHNSSTVPSFLSLKKKLFGVWGLGFGVWGLVYGVLGLWFKVSRV